MKKVNRVYARLNRKVRNFLRRKAIRLGLLQKDHVTRALRYESDRSGSR